MGKKIPKPGTVDKSAPSGADASAAVDSGADARELQVLHPQQEIRLRDRLLEIREYGYIEGLKLQAQWQPFLAALYGLFSTASSPPPAAAVRQVLAMHAVTVQWLMAQSFTAANDNDPQAFSDAIRENAEWVGTLNDIEGDLLMAVWWGVNGGFFSRRIRELALAARAAAASGSAQGDSTQP